jgi:KDO2-lipid IV(A) lauroyltransferase
LSRDLLAGRPWVRRAAYRAMDGVANRLPMGAARLLAYAVATFIWLADPRGRVTVRRNLAHFIPPHCPEALARSVRACYRSLALALCEGLRLGRLPERYLSPERLTLVDPWKVFAKRPMRGPAILVTVHANWDLMLAAVHRLKLIEQVEAITLSQGDPAIDHLFERKRALAGCRSLLLDRAPLAALRALKNERVLGILADRDYTGNGVRVPFAGQPMALPLGPAALAVQTGAPIVPMVLVRRSPSRFAVVVGKPLLADASLPKQAQLRTLTDRLARTLVRFIAAAPAQWIAFHDAWRDGEGVR